MRRLLTSRWALTPPASQTWWACSLCASACMRLLPPGPLPSWATHAHAACAADMPFPLCHISPCHTRLVPLSDVPPLDSRQDADAFNQPLSFDTSSVTDMDGMFAVRFRLCAFCPHSRAGPHTRTPRALLIRPSLCVPHLRATRVVPLSAAPFGLSAGCACFQPAAERKHLQRHRHEPHVLCALPPTPSAPTPELGHTRTLRALLIRPSLRATSPCHTRRPSVDCPLWTRQATAYAFNQPLSFDTSSVTDMSLMFNVRFRLRLLPPLPSWATHARRVRC